ncbi:nucleotide-binding protein [Sphingobium indicum]|uniref:Nucleotide-binding protein n=2 Tax=Sphingobium indicum TaxID=332055 RepID=A0A1L5BTF4_SPHIB|nr:OB-fold domain-containing protein [Sphingobium indicum]APL96117.1 nucleotide-binding protein [Sphingobium indicum B90A]KEY99563.1 nucleotide-binding protein [Sphingomonas sp. BHC-A]NYI24112.1 hypothetical protein [Sphingobium indicum]RYL99174.1 nucleotide-binding protein [Sphingobium indicum]
MTDSTPLSDFRPVRSGLMTGALDDLASVGLAGSRCRACGETTLGANTLCPNCGSDDVFPIALSDEGKVWTYTVVRYRPPGDYKGAEPFQPFAIGLVELPEGLRVVAPVGGDPDAVRIGMTVRFTARARADGVVEFVYNPAA